MPPGWVVVALTVVCSATGGPSAVAAAARAPRAPRAPSEDVRFPVGVRTRVFVDRSRSTPTDVPAAITPEIERRLETRLYYPARGDARRGDGAVADAEPRRGPFPVVLFSPGAPGIPKDYEPLLLDVAAAGYVVAAVTFPVSSVAGPDEVAWRDLPAQSADARFVLGRVLGLDPAKAGIPEVDHHRVATMGHSFGGATTLSLVSPCCRDRRVDAAVVLGSVIRTVHGPTLRAPSGPVLFVHARRDGAVP